MTPTAIIREAQADGVMLAVSPTGTIKATGDGAAVNRWLAVIREHKAEILEMLKVGAADMATASRWWLIHNPDGDPVEVACYPEAAHGEILGRHPEDVAAEPFVQAIRRSPALLTAEEETAIRAWLAQIEETNPTTIAEVIEQCQRDADAREYFSGRAVTEPPMADPFPDDRRTCSQCANLVGHRCLAAWRGEIVANRDYEPVRDQPRRCEGYVLPKGDSNEEEGPQ